MSAWTELCRDRPCVSCGVENGTIVPAHANEQQFGKGMGLKASDWTVVPLCLACHAWLDKGPSRREEKMAAWRRWWFVHMAALLQAGLVVAVDAKVPRGTARRVKKQEAPVYVRPSKCNEHTGYRS